jgi:hypothetical protein
MHKQTVSQTHIDEGQFNVSSQRGGIMKRNSLKKMLNLLGLSLVIGMSLVLTACSDTSKPAATAGFSLLASGGVSVAQGASNSVTLTIKRTNNFSGAIDLGIDGLPAGINPSFSDNPVTGNSTTLTLEVSDTTAMGTYSFTVKGIANDMEKTATVSLEVVSAATQVDTVSIQNNGSSTQVHQGQDFTLELTGKGLANIIKAKLGDVDGYIAINEADNNTFLPIYFNIMPHGDTIGARTLTLTTSTGTIQKEDVITITAITIGPDGNDTKGRGTPDSPYRSVSHVIQTYNIAGSGDTVKLLDGTYSTASGETLPLNIDKGILLEGESQAGVVFEGNGVNTCFKFEGSGSVANLTLSGCLDAVAAKTGTVNVSKVVFKDNVETGIKLTTDAVAVVENSSFENNSIGLEASDNSKVTIGSSSFETNSIGGLEAKDNSQVNVNNSNFTTNNWGIYLHDKASANLTDTSIADSTENNVLAFGDASLSMVGGTIAKSGDLYWGLWLSSAAELDVSLDGVTIAGSGSSGVGLEGTGGSLKLRNSTITNTTNHNIYISGNPASIDLGNATEAGNNTFKEVNVGSFHISDYRAVDQTAAIMAYGNTFEGGGAQPTGLEIAVVDGDDSVPFWYIHEQDNSIDFGP